MADVWIKFCGCTSSSDVALAAEAGADAFGMIFAPSPRRVTWQAVNDIAVRVPPSIQPVAVFVNPARGEVEKVQSLFPRAWLQFAGDESPGFVADYGEKAIKTIHVSDGGAGLGEAAGRYPYALLMLDSRHERLRGGTGASFDWEHASEIAKERRVVIAGGLTPENVGDCVERLHPFGVDVRSGIETDGRKDIAKMRAFVRAVRRR
jgi:phosphoribosylanthranilate isomerase